MNTEQDIINFKIAVDDRLRRIVNVLLLNVSFTDNLSLFMKNLIKKR